MYNRYKIKKGVAVMNKEILSLLMKNARYTAEDISIMTGMSKEDVITEIRDMEHAGIICGYKPVINIEKIDKANVSALIELKVTPEANKGFEDIAMQIMKYSEVESVYLMSGGYDLCCIVKGKTFQEVAMFVGKVLAPMHGVISTATHFVLRRYKEMDVILSDNSTDDRGSISL